MKKESKMPEPSNLPAPLLPKSLEGHIIPDDRLELIAGHMQGLAAAAHAISDQLPLQADVGDFSAILEAEKD